MDMKLKNSLKMTHRWPASRNSIAVNALSVSLLSILTSIFLTPLKVHAEPSARAVSLLESKRDLKNDGQSAGRKENGVDAITESFSKQTFPTARWRNVTPENKINIMQIARLTGRNVDDVTSIVNRILEAESKENPREAKLFACAEHGRMDPEIAIELARALLLSESAKADLSGELETIARDYREFCGKGEVPKLGWLSDESCAELIKFSRLSPAKSLSVSELLASVKELRGLGLAPGIDGDTATELVKTAAIYGREISQVSEMYREAYGFSWLGREWNLSKEDSIALVQAALAKGTTDVKPMLGHFRNLHGFYGLVGKGAYSTNHASVAEMIKLASAARVSVNTIQKQAIKSYGWGVGDVMYGLSRESAVELQKLAYLEKPKVRQMLVLHHRASGVRVDRAQCAQLRERVSGERSGAPAATSSFLSFR